MEMTSNDEIRNKVRENYGKVAVSPGGGCCAPAPSPSEGVGCCAPSNAQSPEAKSKAMGYSDEEVTTVPQGANLGLGCGNPQAIASLKKGETVLDLGSGAGFDSFLAAPAVGETGLVIGVDMTPEMLEKARENLKKSEHQNIQFRLGEIENLPVGDNQVDVIISNCVINLSPDKPRVFQETFRVLKKGGRLAISDVVASTEMPEAMKKDFTLYTGCVSGASPVADLEKMLADTGFQEIRIQPKDSSKDFIREWVPGTEITDYVLSATIEAVKP